ncbi:hypothetical protein L615_003200000340 [Nocardioides sp. J9]|nr:MULTISPECIES: hypothetical protein [unclassified Nocardioides]TWG98156.1 hypothetical protein L615_003200000340 [Nocardioides sp. J9]
MTPLDQARRLARAERRWLADAHDRLRRGRPDPRTAARTRTDRTVKEPQR